jgi:hypothetical protein
MNLPFCRPFAGESGVHVPLAMQKVEGSNPLSRHLQVFLGEATQNKLVCRHFLMTRTIDLLFGASTPDAAAGTNA